VKRRSLKTMPVRLMNISHSKTEEHQLPAERGKHRSGSQRNVSVRVAEEVSTRLAWRLLFANHKQASTLAAGCSGDIVSTTRSASSLILVDRGRTETHVESFPSDKAGWGVLAKIAAESFSAQEERFQYVEPIARHPKAATRSCLMNAWTIGNSVIFAPSPQMT